MRNRSVDAFRLIASFGIILLHVDFFYLPDSIKNNVRLLGRFSVPFFFLIAGYYFYQNYLKNQDQYFLKNLQRLISVFVFASLMYLPFGLEEIYLNYQLFARGGSFHLWFISALIFGTVICWYNLSSFKNDVVFLLLSIAILLLCLVSDSYAYLVSFPRDIGFSMYLIALPFFFAGTLIAKRNVMLSTSTATLLVASGIGLQIAESYFLLNTKGINPFNHQFLLGTILYSFGMFFLSFSGLNSNLIGDLGRKYSLGIYLYHILICRFMASKVKVEDNSSVLFLNPVTIFLVTMFLLMLIEKYMPRFFLLLNGDFQLDKKENTSTN